jgi:hypothetical protein
MNGAAAAWLAAAVTLFLGGISQEAPMAAEGQLFVHPLDTLDGLELHAATAQIAEVDGKAALELDGVALVPELELGDVGIQVEILAPAPCYPGIVFRLADLQSYELAYAVPVASGQSDAVQYDPVFNGSNTWQLHTGPAYQKNANVPTGEWFTLRIDVVGERAAIQVGDQQALVVERLSHEQTAGRVGVWTFRPARFRNLRVTQPRSLDSLFGEASRAPEGAVDAWWLPGIGRVASEPNGVLNVNRYKPASDAEVRLIRCFDLEEEIDLEISFGYSDELRLSLDDTLLFEGANTFTGFENQEARGWVRPENNRLVHRTGAGRHRLEAVLRLSEPFGWGLVVALAGGELHLLPPDETASELIR